MRLTAGLYGLSNAGLDVLWPKVANLKTQLRSLLDEASDLESMVTGLFNALGDRSVAADDSLPCGIPLVWERQLSAAFIRTPDELYGTRCSTVVITEHVEAKFITQVFERSFDAHGELAVVRTALLENWPPRPGDGGLVEVVERLALPRSPRRGALRKH